MGGGEDKTAKTATKAYNYVVEKTNNHDAALHVYLSGNFENAFTNGYAFQRLRCGGDVKTYLGVL